MARILVTGAAGFIGFHLSKRLLDSGHEVVGVDAIVPYYDINLKKQRLNALKHHNFVFIELDISDFYQLNQNLKDYKFDYIVHLAAQPGVRYSVDHPFEYSKHNLTGMLSILEFARSRVGELKNFVFASSSSVYGKSQELPFKISQKLDSPVSLYAATKIADESMAYSYSHMYGIRSVALRFFTVYGPYGRPDMAVWGFTEKINNNKQITLFNEGQLLRDFTYIDDIVSGIVKTLDLELKMGEFKVYNLGNNKPEKVAYLVELIEKNLGKKANIQYLPMAIGDMEATFADISESSKDLGFYPKVSLEEGIKLFIEWYVNT